MIFWTLIETSPISQLLPYENHWPKWPNWPNWPLYFFKEANLSLGYLVGGMELHFCDESDPSAAIAGSLNPSKASGENLAVHRRVPFYHNMNHIESYYPFILSIYEMGVSLTSSPDLLNEFLLPSCICPPDRTTWTAVCRLVWPTGLPTLCKLKHEMKRAQAAQGEV